LKDARDEPETRNPKLATNIKSGGFIMSTTLYAMGSMGGTTAGTAAPGTAGTAGAAAEQPNMIQAFLPLIVIFVLFYFIILMPNKKEQKKQQEMIKALKPGDKVITTGGIVGVIEKVIDAEDIIRIRTGESTLINMKRSYVSAKVEKPAENAAVVTPEKK
jgi:preprotein translocase subunit YajC